jgi:hypothetical protein
MISISTFFQAVKPHLNEKLRRILAAALTIGGDRGTTTLVTKETGISFREIRRGLDELALEPTKSSGFRKKRSGRKKITETNPEVLKDLKDLVDATTRDDPESPLLWTCKCCGLSDLSYFSAQRFCRIVGPLVWEVKGGAKPSRGVPPGRAWHDIC